MPTLSAATQSNPWLMVFYRRLIQREAAQGRALRRHAQTTGGHLLGSQTPTPFRSLPQPTIRNESRL
jgi:hypothetical protein